MASPASAAPCCSSPPADSGAPATQLGAPRAPARAARAPARLGIQLATAAGAWIVAYFVAEPAASWLAHGVLGLSPETRSA